MELHYSTLSLLSAFLLFLLMVVKNVKTSKTNKSITKLPPGPWQLPLVGNLHNLVGSSTHHILTDLAKKHGPLMYLHLGQVPTFIVSSPEIAKQVMKEHDAIFSHRPSFLASRVLSYESTSIGFSPYGNYWRQLRKICTMELLSSKRVQTYQSIREEEVSNLIKEIASSNEINLSEKIYSLTYGITARAAFGKKSKHQEAFRSSVGDAIQLLTGFSIVDMYPSVKLLQVLSGEGPRVDKVHKNIDKILENILNDHKERKAIAKGGDTEVKEDLVDVLLRIQKQGDAEFQLMDNNIKAVIWDIFSAGSETSSTAVEWAMSEMLKNPRIMERAQNEVRKLFDERRNVDETGLHDLKYLKSVIKETLRLHPSAPLLVPRENSEGCEIDGYTIPVKSKIIINAWMIGRDPRYWPEPDRFDPMRFLNSEIDYKGTDFEYIPFGAGRRICPGISFAMANIELPLAQLLYHFDWKLAHGLKNEELDMTEAFGLTVRRKKDLFLIPIPYHPSPAE